jgi:hypothetical protein
VTTSSPALPWWASLGAVVGGLAWIPVRLGVSVSFSTELLRLTYVEWNKLMVVPLALMAAAGMGLLMRAPTRAARVGAATAVAGLIGMLAGVVVEFFVFGGLEGDREGAIVGWMLYLLGGLLVHVIGLVVMGLALRRTPVGLLALAIGTLHVAWLPAGMGGAAVLVADQVAIGLGWVALGVVGSRRGAG